MGGYLKGIFALVFLITLILYLVPGERLKKYVRFFAEMMLTIGILTPLLGFVCDSDQFLEMIEYETFTENLSEVARDMERMEYIQSDYYREEYENAISEDVKQMSETIAEKYGYYIAETNVTLSGTYEVQDIAITLSKQKEEEIQIEKIKIYEPDDTRTDWMETGGLAEELRGQLTQYYQVSAEQIHLDKEGRG